MSGEDDVEVEDAMHNAWQNNEVIIVVSSTKNLLVLAHKSKLYQRELHICAINLSILAGWLAAVMISKGVCHAAALDN